MLKGVRQSFDHLPLLSLGVDKPLLDLLIGLLQAGTTLAVRLAAPMLVTMLVVDLALGLVGKVMPQFNVMQAGQSVRAVIGMVIVAIGLAFTAPAIQRSLNDALDTTKAAWTPKAAK